MQTVVEQQKQEVNPSNKIHLTFEHDPYMAYCGAKLKGVTAFGPVECQECKDIAHLVDELEL